MNESERQQKLSKSHMPDDSVLFEKIVPVVLIGLGVITAVVVVIVIGIIAGVIPT
ncbi:MAG: hypothetical protein GY803_19505 [Chloroflexi bacterium]|nr:hypothetical protein [Chloroflexota bacterium]